MAIIKCKMCGGDIDLSADKTFGVCEYCGSTMTFPKIDDEHRAAAFNRGNHFRRIGEFDKALAIYENIVRENDDDAEAHWCCALCRFGIEYVEDPASHEWLPTCHRASFDSILEDVDYQAALEHSDGVTRRQYEKDAVKIAEVQRGILATSQKEEPFDVFICYKETNDSGERTRDSMLAQDVYYQLTEKGYRVFFARITLEDKAGSEYEPYIFAALNSAKVMICIGTKPEHFNAVWVKNEWSRFLALMRKDRKKLLLPCYRDMDPYDLPEQLSVLQSYDMSKIGFIQDLIRGVSKVVDAEKASAKPAQTVVVNQAGGNANQDALLKRGNMALEDGDWASADEYFDRVLDANAECAEAYLGKFLASKQTATLTKYVQNELTRLGSGQTRKLTAVEPDSARIEATLERLYGTRWAPQQSCFDFDRSYSSTLASRQEQKQATLAAFDGEKLLHRAHQFADEKLKAELTATRKSLADGLDARIVRAQTEDEASVARIKAAYAAHLLKTEAQLVEEKRKRDEVAQRQQEAEASQRAEEYRAACAAQGAAKTAVECRAAGEKFSALGDYEDSAPRAEACRKSAEVLEAEAIAARKRKIRIILEICVAVVVAVIAIVLLMTKIVIPAYHYHSAKAMLEAGDHDGAIVEYEAAGGYSDASERLRPLYYDKAEELESTGDLKKAAIAYGRAYDYADAAERSRALWDQVAERKTVAGAFHTVGLKSDGTVVAVGKNYKGQCDVSGWTDIVAVEVGFDHTVGLKSDGTVVAVGNNGDGQCDVSNWTDIVAIAADLAFTVGLKSDGTVVAVGYNEEGQCDVSDWTDIVAIAADEFYTVGLKADGTVVTAGLNNYTFGNVKYSPCNVTDWKDIVAISAYGDRTMGLKSDGTVITTEFQKVGDNANNMRHFGEWDVSDWTDIVAVEAGLYHTVGLKADGTVVAIGNNDDGECNVSDWIDIVAITAGSSYTVGLKTDGTVVAVGSNNDGKCDVFGWTGIKLP